ncbi:formyltransferase family protein [Algibacillus agarilyticus]|uniref:formyltransferase family protein n=1 Tax=Algibacillus agarilyticus TaxID=2234133 RepID=UPI000DD0C399|nr:formyltransferase family protein [Algibacillus agarilyticus]
MNVIYFGNDLFSGCLSALIQAGHTIQRVYINEPEDNAHKVIKICQQHNIEYSSEKPPAAMLIELAQSSTDMFVIAEYLHKIPQTSVKYAFNIHPTLLPLGRSMTPLAYLLTHTDAAGVTLHKVTDEFDAGDIIVQAPIAITQDDSLNSLTYKIQALATQLCQQFLIKIEDLYNQAQPQNAALATEWPIPTQAERTLNFQFKAKQLKQLHRQYGHYGVFFILGDQCFHTSHIEFLAQTNTLQPGDVVYEDASLLMMACADAYLIFEKKYLQRITD